MTTSYTDLPAAMIAWLRAQPTVVDAFGEDTSAKETTKFWGDEAEGLPAMPWAVYVEDPGPQTYMTGTGPGRPYIDEGTVRFFVVAASKKTGRRLGKMVASALTDPPLTFQDGLLMSMRPGNSSFVPAADIAPNSPGAYVRMVVFSVMVQRQT